MDQQLRQEMLELAALVRRRKAQIAAAVKAGSEEPLSDLIAIAKLEARLASMRQLLQAHELTVGPLPAPVEAEADAGA